ncbi:MAG: NADH-quinone oxidoreductase subunit NuoK [Calditrichaeota bacterium]|nr:NADH-quinone oxidoreductase subunit NuoK [Candidatus Cloacimonadota bacterium]MCB1048588.1 NADH-quinone oxidoreductase subunit NuoK [Calditrichota bacterium]
MILGANHYLLLGLVLFGIGTIGVLVRRNILIILMSVELMINAVNLLLVAFSRYNGNLDGQVFTFFTMTVAAAEVAVGLAIVVMIYRHTGSTDIGRIRLFRG